MAKQKKISCHQCGKKVSEKKAKRVHMITRIQKFIRLFSPKIIFFTKYLCSNKCKKKEIVWIYVQLFKIIGWLLFIILMLIVIYYIVTVMLFVWLPRFIKLYIQLIILS